MFPPFIDSFGNQLTAVLINTVGSVLGSAISAFVSAFVNAFVSPFFQNLAGAVGLN